MAPSSQKVMVFGGSGLIGSSLCALLCESNDCSVQALSSKECDLLDAQSVQALMREYSEDTSIVFCAGKPRQSSNSWEGFLSNAGMLQTVLEAMTPGQVRNFVYLSSVCVYGMPPQRLPIDEQTVLQPSDFYGLAKLASEYLCRYMLPAECPCTILRLPGVYGDDDTFRSVVGQLTRDAVQIGVMTLSGDGSTKRDYVAVGDICRIIQDALRTPRSTTINITTGENMSLKDIALLIAETLGIEPRIEYTAEDSARKYDLEFIPIKREQEFPHTELISMREGITKYVQRFAA